MKNTVSLLLLVLCFAASGASAQWELSEGSNFYWNSNFFQRSVRPYRDRTERFDSARLDALQMRIAVGDEADQLTLEGWGDNRADIRAGSSRALLEYGPLAGSEYWNSTKDLDRPGSRAGAYGRFGTLEVEGSRIEQNENPVPSVSWGGYSYKDTGAGAGLSFGGAALRLGLHGNFNKGDYNASPELETRNNAAGGAMALRAGILELGVTADYVDRGVSYQNYDETRTGPMLGAQAMIRPFGGLKAALRASVAKLTGGIDDNGSRSDLEGNNSELGARAEWAFQAVPFTVAASFERITMDPKYTSGGQSGNTDAQNTLKTAGAALHPFGGRILIGAELKELDLHYNEHDINSSSWGYDQEWDTMTGGAEIWLLPCFAVRGSFQRMELKANGAATKYDIAAVGAGLKGKRSSLDASLRRMKPRDAWRNEYEEGRLTYGYKF